MEFGKKKKVFHFTNLSSHFNERDEIMTERDSHLQNILTKQISNISPSTNIAMNKTLKNFRVM
jgi:hypothetical protein